MKSFQKPAKISLNDLEAAILKVDKMLAKLISRKGRYHRIQKLPWLKRMISFFFEVKGKREGGKSYKKVVLQNSEI